MMKQRNTRRPNAKLADRDIPDLRRRLAMGLSTVREEAARFQVGVETIRRADRGDTFAHLLVDGVEPLGVPKAIAPMPTEEELNSGLARLMEEQRKVQEANKNKPDVDKILGEIQKHGTSAAAQIIRDNPLDE